jgi:hypothetical protein
LSSGIEVAIVVCPAHVSPYKDTMNLHKTKLNISTHLSKISNETNKNFIVSVFLNAKDSKKLPPSG